MKYDDKNDKLILQEPHLNYLLFVFEENGGKGKKSPDGIRMIYVSQLNQL